MPGRWTVVKFGGTSVSAASGWDVIAQRARRGAADGRTWIVASALSGVSDRLERAISEALAGGRFEAFAWIEERHRRFLGELGAESARDAVETILEELRSWLEGIRLTGEASARLRARAMACGEMLSTRIGIAALVARGVEARWVDARDLLAAAPRPGAADADRYLEAEVVVDPDPDAGDRAAAGAEVVLTQGFVARTARGETCLLGRGGSDTSAALFARLLDARALEIWTDVHGMFTADPRRIPTARLIRRIGYREARELAAMGAKVLHPRCLAPAEASGIPVDVRNTFAPEAPGTRVWRDEDEPTVTAVSCRTGVTLITLSTLSMWGASGFLARAFRPFDELGVSVDLVATSQSAVSVTLDRVPGGTDGEAFESLLARLREMGEVDVVHPCAVVSIVGRRIRAVLHELGPAMAVFREHRVHLVSESSEDLNLSFVVDEDDARPLVRELHGRLFAPQAPAGRDARFGDTWERLERGGAAPATAPGASAGRWWRRRRDDLLRAVEDGSARYVYHVPTVRDRARDLRARVPAVDRWYYAMKANPHPAILRALAGEGVAIECVSLAEVRRAREVVGASVAILFTPNFCPPDEYAAARAEGAEVTVDGPETLDLAPDAFRDADIAVRLDPGGGLGHHEKVRTAGPGAKFGFPAAEAERLGAAAERAGARVVGVHAHVGSGIRDAGAWAVVFRALAEAARAFPDVRWIDVGGGIGVVERPGQSAIDLDAMNAALAVARREWPEVELRLEPGRYLVAEAGVLVAPVTQVRAKAGVRFVGVATGMNSLIRPALYGAWHAIHNLTRLDEPAVDYAHVVGPICETGDVLGRDRLLPATVPGDVLLVDTCGAYGAAMASRYNLREPAAEVVFDP